MRRLLLGRGSDGRGWVVAGPEESLLVLGPPRCGKTTAVAIPNVLAAEGATVATSTKADLAAVTVARRARLGRCWWWDPSGTTPAPAGTEALSWSPVSGCDSWETAVSRAHLLAVAARPGGGLAEATHWVNRAEALLAPLLHAAGLIDVSLRWVMRWVLSHEVYEARSILAAKGTEMAGESLDGILASEDRERSGIFSTAAAILSPYRSEAALDVAEAASFDPAVFVGSSDTMYVCAPARVQDQLAPIVVALLDEVRGAAYADQDRAPVVWVLDEVAQVAPMPFLPAVAAEGGGQGLLTVACLQDLSQARVRWGAAAEGFVSLFGSKVVFPGIGDHRTLELVSALGGDHQVPMRSHGPRRGLLWRPTVSWSTTWRRRLPVDEVARGRPGHTLMFSRTSDVAWLRLAPYYADAELAALAGVAPQRPQAPKPPSSAGRRRSPRQARRQAIGILAALVMLLALPAHAVAVGLVVGAVFAAAYLYGSGGRLQPERVNRWRRR